jgi:hypothetical protein
VGWPPDTDRQPWCWGWRWHSCARWYGFSITGLVAFGVITQLIAAGMFFALRRPLAEAAAEI